MRKIQRTLAAGLLLLPGIVSAAEDADVSLSSILSRGFQRQAAPRTAGAGTGDLLAAVAEAQTFPIACGTPLVSFLVRPESTLPAFLQEAGALVAGRPRLVPETVSLTQDGRFAIHYPALSTSSGLSVDRDRNGLPDLVDRVAEALAAARSSLVTRLGYPPPADDEQRFDVYLVELGHGLEGFAVSGFEEGDDGGETERASSFMVLDAALPAPRVMPAALHQMAHLSLQSLSPRAPRFWAEAGAAYVTRLVTGDRNAHQSALRARLQTPGRGLASDGMLLMEGSLLWAEFLAESAGDVSIIRQIWEEMQSLGPDPLAATDAVLRRSGRTLFDAAREYAAWNLFTGDRDDGQHYESGHSLPTAALAPALPDAPFRFESSEAVEPLGSIAFRLPGDGRGGMIDFEVFAEGGRPGADLLVFYRPWGPQPVLAPVAFDSAGSARISIPWADAREAWIILRNDGLPGGGNIRFEARALSDPYAPYDLAALTATDSGSSILLEWTTVSEKGLRAWNLYRSETPGGPFTRLNSVAVPAMGESASDTGYIFVDDIARPGRRYYYLVEGLTALGLPQRSHVVSGRIAPAP